MPTHLRMVVGVAVDEHERSAADRVNLISIAAARTKKACLDVLCFFELVPASLKPSARPNGI